MQRLANSISGQHDMLQVSEKSFPEMKKRCRDDHCSKSKETRMEMGSIFVLYIQPTIPTYTYITTL